jgi:ABC-type branched-subunit amino acid transport system substrate-binding protein
MNRRRFFRLAAGRLAAASLASGALAAGGIVGSRERAWAQAGAPAQPGGKTAPAVPEPLTASAPGVSARDVKIGMSAAFKGPAAGLGTELWRGATAYFSEINARGGVNGRSVVVSALDDGYQPDPCLRNTMHLVEQDPVFFLSNYVGTPTLTRDLPAINS